jgi:ATP-dependent exoDNAse (exonuclease V) alpha subunit
VRLYFIMTINKAQGQSLQKVGIDLRQSVFTHGQFYVAFSRVTDMANLDVLLPYRGSGMVENIVYPEVLLR